jgi:hypothetical protein
MTAGKLVAVLAMLGAGLTLPTNLAAQGLPVYTGSHVPLYLWFLGSVILGLALAYGILRNRRRSRAERATTEQATKNLYAEEGRERRGM